jgi:hypothetical protein
MIFITDINKYSEKKNININVKFICDMNSYF